MSSKINNTEAEIESQFIGNKIENINFLGSEKKIDPTTVYDIPSKQLKINETIENLKDIHSEWLEKRILVLSCLDQSLQNTILAKLLEKLVKKKKYEKRLLQIIETEDTDKVVQLNALLNVVELNTSVIIVELSSNNASQSFISSLLTRNEGTTKSLKDNDTLILCQIKSDAIQIYKSFYKHQKESFIFSSWHISFLKYLPAILKKHYEKEAKELGIQILKGWKEGRYGDNVIELYNYLMKYFKIGSLHEFRNKISIKDKVLPEDIMLKAKDKEDKLIYQYLMFVMVFFPRLNPREFEILIRFLLEKHGTQNIERQVKRVKKSDKNKTNSALEDFIKATVKFANQDQSPANQKEHKTKKAKVKKKVSLLKKWSGNVDKYAIDCELGVFVEENTHKKYVGFNLPYLREDMKAYMEKQHSNFINKNGKSIIFNAFLFKNEFSDFFKSSIISLIVNNLSADEYYFGTSPIIRLIIPLLPNEILKKKYEWSEVTEKNIENCKIDDNLITAAILKVLTGNHLKQFFNLIFGLLDNEQTAIHIKRLFNLLINQRLAPIVLLLVKFKGYPQEFDKVYWIKQLIHRGNGIDDIMDLVKWKSSLDLRLAAYSYLVQLPNVNVDRIYETLEKIREDWLSAEENSVLETNSVNEQKTNKVSPEKEIENEELPESGETEGEFEKEETTPIEGFKDGNSVEDLPKTPKALNGKGGIDVIDDTKNIETSAIVNKREDLSKSKNNKSYSLRFLYNFSHLTQHGFPLEYYGLSPSQYPLFVSFTNNTKEIKTRFSFLIEWLFHPALEGDTYCQPKKISLTEGLWRVVEDFNEINPINVIYRDFHAHIQIVQLDNLMMRPHNADLIETWFSILVGDIDGCNQEGITASKIMINVLHEYLSKKEIRYLTKIWGQKYRFYRKLLTRISKTDKSTRKPIETRKKNIKALTNLLKEINHD